jgi:hypothetical protein
MSEIRIAPALSDADILRSLEVYNVVHAPHRESLAGVRETERRSEDFVIFIAHLDGEVPGAAHTLFARHALTPNGDVCVLPELRRRGIGG